MIANDEDRKSSHTKLPRLLEFLREWRWMIEYSHAEIREAPQVDPLEAKKSVRESIVSHARICSTTNSNSTSDVSPASSINTANSAPIHNCYVNHAIAAPSSTTATLHSPRRNCLIHQHAYHPIWQCRVFNAMSLDERKDVIRLSKACTLCLETGHESSECSKTFRCTVTDCRLRHNVLLHEPRVTT